MSDCFICFILTVTRRLAACVLRATKIGSLLFEERKCIRVTWLEDFLTSKWPGSFTALAPPLHYIRQYYHRVVEETFSSAKCVFTVLSGSHEWHLPKRSKVFVAKRLGLTWPTVVCGNDTKLNTENEQLKLWKVITYNSKTNCTVHCCSGPSHSLESSTNVKFDKVCWKGHYVKSMWLIEQGLTSHRTHYRLYWGRVATGQMTLPTVSKHWRKIGF